MLRFVITIFITIIMEGKNLGKYFNEKTILIRGKKSLDIIGKNNRNYNIGIYSLIYILL